MIYLGVLLPTVIILLIQRVVILRHVNHILHRPFRWRDLL